VPRVGKPEPTGVEQINFSWLLKLRWGAIAGQAVTVAAVDRIMSIRLPVAPLAAILLVELGTNLFYQRRLATGAATRSWECPALMALDVVLLTGLLYLTGGPLNPFSFFYLVEIALGAVVLRPRWIWTLVALSLACSGILFVYHRELALTHLELMRIHLAGMWVAFGVAAAFIVYFLLRITRALAHREAELEASRRTTARNERLASLATLAAGAAHELATPLSTIALVAGELERALVRGAEPQLAREDVQLIRQQVQRCRAILDQMSADAGEHAGESIAAVSAEEILQAAASDLPAVRFDVDPPLEKVRWELPPRAVAQAIRGVIRNALDASPPGTEVLVRASARGAQLALEICDRGAGMPAEVLARAGEPFFTTKPPGQGMGLGLFLARALIERLGGQLQLQSTCGQGTTATLVLPAAAARPEGLG
jgi:two-component system sensor histidine kinase RegB